MTPKAEKYVKYVIQCVIKQVDSRMNVLHVHLSQTMVKDYTVSSLFFYVDLNAYV